MSIKIKDNVVEQFSAVYRKNIVEYIEKMVSQGVKVQQADTFLSFKFSRNEVYIYKGNQFEVEEFVHLPYGHIIPDSFLYQFIDIKSELPTRLSRWAEVGYLEYIYNEIVQTLSFHRMFGLINPNKETEWEWKSAGVRMVMNQNFTFHRLELI